MEAQETGKGKGWKRVFLVAGVVGVVAAMAVITMSFLTKGKSGKRQTVQQIAILRPPPPPPPPKPEKQPEPEMKKQEVKLPEPNKAPEPQKAEAPPPGPDLGVDAKGDGSGDSFGLVGKPGGKDITTIGGGGGGGSRFTWYAGLVQGEIQKVLSREKKLRGAEFKAVVNVWVSAEGKMQRAELAGSSGDSQTDELLKLALAEMPSIREVPPPEMPQPIRLRITSRF